MNIGNMTILKKNSHEDAPSESLKSSSSTRGGPLNPEATVFCLPSHEPKESNDDSEQEHLYMNGDVGKEMCGEFCPPEFSHSEALVSKKGMNPAKYVSEVSDTSAKMTEAVRTSMEKLTTGVVRVPPPNPENSDKMNGSHKENGDQQVEPIPQENGDNDDTGQCKDNSDIGNQTSNEPSSREEIKELVARNIEFFFSRENWSSDSYLLSQMDSDQYVPVYILANCSSFQNITKDHSIIMEALKESVFVQLDEEKNRVRPNYKRCIVILREISETTPVKEIEAMFESENCPKAISCEFVHNNSWYVTFESDSDAQKAYRYLRETVKTFQGKPILARIKTKPMSRIGCLSVLPSYGGKPPCNVRDGQGTVGNANQCVSPGAPAAPNLQGIGNPPLPSAYPPNNPHRMFYPQSNMNASYPNYNFTGSTQIPTAYFYPNPMLQWQPPNFYDINSFIQYNGLSPRGAFKPPSSARFSGNTNNNNNRRKNRDKYEKTDSRQTNGSSNSRLSSQVNNRPQSAQSPHLVNQPSTNTIVNHSSNNQMSQPSSFPKGETTSTNSNTLTTPNNNISSSNQNSGQNSFAQNDLSIASQSNLYTSFSSTSGNANTDKVSTGKVDKSENGDPQISSSETSSLIVNSTETTPQTSEVVSSSLPSVVISSSVTESSTVPSSFSQSQTTNSVNQVSTTNSNLTNQTQSNLYYQHHPSHGSHHQHHTQSVAGNLRNQFPNESYSTRDLQPSRPLRGSGRRRISRREEEMNSGSGTGSGRGSQRVVSTSNGSGDFQSKNSAHSEAKKPSFELQATSFPPLPSAEEIAASNEEKHLESTSTTAWSGETHKFSDVMKGTVKTKQTLASSERESSDQGSHNTPQSTSHTEPIKTKSSTESGPLTTNQISNKTDSPPPPSNNTSVSSSKITSEPVQSSASNSSRPERASSMREQRPPREDRRNTGIQGGRRDREYTSGVGRGNLRRERDGGSRLSGNKENRPQTSSRSWREDRVDPDGWITKGSRETRGHREHRYQNQHSNFQNNYYENRNGNSCNKNQVMVNGDSSPPPPPKPENNQKNFENTKVSSVNSKNVSKPEANQPTKEIISEKEKASDSNEGEHKTSWAKMALASKDTMEKLSAELKEKAEQERLKKMRTTKIAPKVTDRINNGRDRDGKPFRRENFTPRERGEKDFSEKTRDFRGSEKNSNLGFKSPREALRPKSPK